MTSATTEGITRRWSSAVSIALVAVIFFTSHDVVFFLGRGRNSKRIDLLPKLPTSWTKLMFNEQTTRRLRPISSLGYIFAGQLYVGAQLGRWWFWWLQATVCEVCRAGLCVLAVFVVICFVAKSFGGSLKSASWALCAAALLACGSGIGVVAAHVRDATCGIVVLRGRACRWPPQRCGVDERRVCRIACCGVEPGSCFPGGWPAATRLCPWSCGSAKNQLVLRLLLSLMISNE